MAFPGEMSMNRGSEDGSDSVDHDTSDNRSIQTFDTDNGSHEKDHKDISPADSTLDLQCIPTKSDIDATEKRGHMINQQHIVQEIPYHVFGPKLKGFLVFIVSLVATLSGLSANIYFPAQSKISEDLHITPEVVNLSIMTYMIAQGLGPSFWAVLADRQGRRTTLVFTLLLYVGANIALALTANGPMLLVFRALQALGSSSTIALGAGVIADIAAPSQRGGYLGWFSGLRQLSLALGPVLGGVLAGSSGWRSIFWFLVAFSGFSVVLILLVLPETLRRIAGNGSTPLTSWTQRPILWSLVQRSVKHTDEETVDCEDHSEIKDAKPFSWKIFLEPFQYLLEWDVACALMFGGCIYTAWSMMVATTTYTLQRAYDFTTIEVGLCFLANGAGCIAGSIIAGRSLNYDFQIEVKLWQHANQHAPEEPFPLKRMPSSFPLEQARLSKGRVYSLVAIWSLLLYGWSLTASNPIESNEAYELSNAHWIVPLLAQFAVGWSATSVLTSNNALVVDLYPGKGASVTAIMNLTRCLMGAAGVAAAQPFLSRFGPGWTSVLLVGICVLGLVPYWLHCMHGQAWRRARETRRANALDVALS